MNKGKLPLLAVACAARLSARSGVPTLASLGVKGFELTHWHALFALGSFNS
ncbi:MAG: hypothetical protein ACK5RC_12580 [Curvibacter sp.]|nr:hypothetical protein [Curvibacter sp.]